MSSEFKTRREGRRMPKGADILKRIGGLRTVFGRALNEDETSEFEKSLGVSLPPAYREFVQKHGGTSTAKMVYVVDAASGNHAGNVAHFYGGGDDATSLTWRVRNYRGRMLPTMIAIAGDGVGNQFCLGVSGPELGRVYFYDHHNEPPYPDEYEEDYGEPMPRQAWFANLSLVAQSFEDFLEQLRVSDEVA